MLRQQLCEHAAAAINTAAVESITRLRTATGRLKARYANPFLLKLKGRRHGQSRADLQEVEGIHRSGLHARQIPEGLCDAAVIAEDDKGSLAADVPTITHLTLAAPDVA